MTNLDKSRRTRKATPTPGEQSAMIYGGNIRPRSRDRTGELVEDLSVLRGTAPQAIDRAEVRTKWRRLWRVVLDGLAPIQLEALRDELNGAAVKR